MSIDVICSNEIHRLPVYCVITCESSSLCGQQSFRHVLWRPFARYITALVVIQIVYISKGGSTTEVRKPHNKGFGEIVTACADASLCITKITDSVFFLQIYVHHIDFIAHIP